MISFIGNIFSTLIAISFGKKLRKFSGLGESEKNDEKQLLRKILSSFLKAFLLKLEVR